MRLCGCVVWYNPGKEEVENIYNYLDELEKLYIVDNSSKINKIEKNKKIEYISLKKNKGIAKALNIACEKAYLEGYEWILTMDQDSTFVTSLKIYKEKVIVQQKKDKNIAIFGCSIKPEEKRGYTSKVITSGNILKLNSWKEINGFNEEFFIDEVDFEFCARIILKNLKIYKISEILLKHKLGNSFNKFFFGLKITCMNHSKIRKYYIIRNRLFMIKKYPKSCKIYRLSIAIEIFNIIFFEKDKINKLKFSYKGFIDYINNKQGELEC